MYSKVESSVLDFIERLPEKKKLPNIEVSLISEIKKKLYKRIYLWFKKFSET